MTEEIREQLSALVDDELSDLERPLLLGRLQRDGALRECLGRYQLIGEVMRGAGKTVTLSVAGRVEQAVEREAGMVVAPGRAAQHWKPLAGMGVAASVALVAVIAVTSLRDSPTETVPAVASAGGESATQVAGGDHLDEERWNRIEPRIDERLSGYLVNHSEYAASRGVQGVMPYVRIVGFSHDR
jgi:sigma-E factor negative regulatory protein RseA